MLAYVGLDPSKDVNWVTHATDKSIALLAEGKIDAFLGFPPDPQELRAKKIGHVVVNSTRRTVPGLSISAAWSSANREFVRKHPVATKRALRAILKAADSARSSRSAWPAASSTRGCTTRYDYALQAMQEIPTASGASTTPRTRCASMPCACTRPG